MLSEEAIEEAIEISKNILKNKQIGLIEATNTFYEAIETLLQYIDELEKSDASKEQSSMNYYNEYKELKQENKKLNKIIDEMVDSFYKLYQKIPGTMHKFFENGKPCEFGYDNETNECKEINCKPCIKQYFEEKVESKKC